MRVLILAYDFPPLVRVGGLRPYSWFRYFHEFGIEPVVVTRQWDNVYGDDRDYVAPSATDGLVVERDEHGTILRTPYRPNLSHRLLLRHGPTRYGLIRKAVTAWYEAGQYYLAIGPKKELYRAARGYLRENRVDAIVATGEPFVLFNYATRLSAEFGIPWIADFRDPWSQDSESVGRRISPAWDARQELRSTRSASFLTTVSESFRDVIAPLHRGKTIHIIRNGYDAEAISSAAGVDQGSERLTIAIAGSLYAWDPIESFLGVCDRLVRQSGQELELRFIGASEPRAVESLLASGFPGLSGCVRFVERLPNDRAAVELSRANVLLMFNNYATVGTKIYDYLALKRKVLLCYSEDPSALQLWARHYNLRECSARDSRPAERLIEETEAGVVVRDERHLEEVLRELLDEFSGSGSIACRSSGTERFSRREQAGRLAALLAELKAS